MKKLILTGNVGRDPEVRTDSAGNSFTTFSVGIATGTKDKPKTDWVDVTCNNKLAEIVQSFLKKGAKVLVEGFPTASAYIKDNKAIATLKLHANNIEFLSVKDSSSHDAPTPCDEMVQTNNADNTNLDDIPF